MMVRRFLEFAVTIIKGRTSQGGAIDGPTSEKSIARYKTQSAELLKARQIEANRFAPRLRSQSEAEVSPVKYGFPGSQALGSIFEFLQRLTLAAGLGVLAQVIQAQKFDLTFGVFFSGVIAFIVALCALYLSVAITIELITKNLPKKITKFNYTLVYVVGSVLILVVMVLFQAAVYSLAKDLPKSKHSISLSQEHNGKKVEITITGDPDLKGTRIQIDQTHELTDSKPQVSEKQQGVD